MSMPVACEQCRRDHSSCSIAVQHRFNECGECCAQGERNPPRSLCSYSRQSLCFFATDFTFKHAPAPCGFDEDVEYQPAPEGYDKQRDEMKYRMQYFYIEKPFENISAWSPVYVRRELEQHGVSPFALTPLILSRREVPELDEEASGVVQQAWASSASTNLASTERPEFAADENVLTCRRICSLYGYLDLEHPRPDAFKAKLWNPGFYKVIWRVQFFKIREDQADRWEILERTQRLSQQQEQQHNSAPADGYKNPMRFPQWDGEEEASYPHRPLLRLSVGYGRLPQRVAEYDDLDFSLGHVSIADQVMLRTENPRLRLDHLVRSSDYWNNTSSGWINIESGGCFEVVRGRPPVFVVSNIDTGDWQGGFRFGGVELRLVDQGTM